MSSEKIIHNIQKKRPKQKRHIQGLQFKGTRISTCNPYAFYCYILKKVQNLPFD